MNLSESFLTALDSITANKMRSILTTLGIIMGIVAYRRSIAWYWRLAVMIGFLTALFLTDQ